MMGGPWSIPTGSQYIRVDDWGARLKVTYGKPYWPSRSYRLFVWEAE